MLVTRGLMVVNRAFLLEVFHIKYASERVLAPLVGACRTHRLRRRAFQLRRSPPPFPEFSTALRMPNGLLSSSVVGMDRVGWTEMNEAGLDHPVAQTAAGGFVVDRQVRPPSA